MGEKCCGSCLVWNLRHVAGVFSTSHLDHQNPKYIHISCFVECIQDCFTHVPSPVTTTKLDKPLVNHEFRYTGDLIFSATGVTCFHYFLP